MSLMGTAAYAGPITTVPWNGHPGAVSFGTPYCYYNDAVEAEIAKEHIVNRNCQGAIKYKWDEEPVWERISSDCYQGNTKQSKGNMSEAKEKNAWTVQLNHGVDGRGFGYGIEPSDMISIMDEAKAQGLWRAPMGRVAAYYRAHFVIDKATATSIDGGFKVTWTSPPPRHAQERTSPRKDRRCRWQDGATEG